MLRAVVPVLSSLAILAGCQLGPSWVHPYGAADPIVGAIQDIAGQRTVDQAALVAELEGADFVLLGGSRDNLDHRRLEAELVEALAEQERGVGALALEMIASDRQGTLVEHLEHGRDRRLVRLGSALPWDERGWGPYEAYRPVLRTARAAGAEIVAAGLPPWTVTAVMAEGVGALPPALARRTGLREPLPPLLAADLDQEIAATHCGQLAAELVSRIAEAQRAIDANLADRLVTVSGRGRGVLIAASQRVRKDWGVPWYIEKLRPTARTVSVAFIEVDRIAEMETEGLAYDYVWFTPSARPPGEEACRLPQGFVDQREARRAVAGALARVRS
jgi:uncharacterized iron-regulated protein